MFKSRRQSRGSNREPYGWKAEIFQLRQPRPPFGTSKIQAAISSRPFFHGKKCYPKILASNRLKKELGLIIEHYKIIWIVRAF